MTGIRRGADVTLNRVEVGNIRAEHVHKERLLSVDVGLGILGIWV